MSLCILIFVATFISILNKQNSMTILSGGTLMLFYYLYTTRQIMKSYILDNTFERQKLHTRALAFFGFISILNGLLVFLCGVAMIGFLLSQRFKLIEILGVGSYMIFLLGVGFSIIYYIFTVIKIINMIDEERGNLD